MELETLSRGNKIRADLADLRNTLEMVQRDRDTLYARYIGAELFKEFKEQALAHLNDQIAKLEQEFKELK